MCKVATNKEEQDARKREKPQSNENKTLYYVSLSPCANQQSYNKVYMHLLTYIGFH